MRAGYKSYLSLLKPISKYSFDISFTEAGADDWRKPFDISRQEFLDELYVDRDVESVIKNHIEEAPDLLCLVGPRGCGKSSIGLKITRDLQRSLAYKYFVVFVDIRMDEVLEALSESSPAEMRRYLHGRIVAEYWTRLFGYRLAADDNPELRLMAFLLEGRDQEIKPRQVFWKFYDVESRAAALFGAYQAVRADGGEPASYYEWLSDKHIGDDQVRALMNELRPMIGLPQLVYAARHIYGFNRHIIWLDNIDAIPEDMQTVAVEALRKFLSSISAYASCVIAVREENVFRKDNLSDVGGPPFETRIIAEMPQDDKGHHYYPSVDVPLVDFDVLRKICSNRMTFALNRQHTMIDHMQQQITVTKERLGKTGDEASRQKLRQLLGEQEAQLRCRLPKISDREYEQLEKLSDKVLDVIQSEKVIFIANNAIRDLLFIHRDVLGFFLKSPNEEQMPPQALEYPDWYLATLFLTWIRNVQRKYQIEMYDIVAECEKWYANKENEIGCLLPHLTLTAIWNLSIERKRVKGRRFHGVQVRHVVQRLELLGYRRDDIVKCMFSLCYYEGTRGNLLEMKVGKDLFNEQEIEDGHWVVITYRGKAFAGYVTSSFGYVHECVRQYKHPERDVLAHPVVETTANHAAEMLPFLCDIASMHTVQLRRILNGGRLGARSESLANYYTMFGIPQEQAYKRRPAIGMLSHGLRRALLFESVISAIGGYVRVEPASSKLKQLHESFMSVMESMSRETDLERMAPATDFRSLLGIAPREAITSDQLS